MAQTDLGKWMITNGGEYDPSVTYEQLTMVKYGNSTYVTLKTVTGVTPDNDKINYQLMAQGFDATALSAVTAQDQQGLLGDKGSEVSAQSLIDALADKVMNTVIAKLGTGALPSGMNDVISGLATLNSNFTALSAIKSTSASYSVALREIKQATMLSLSSGTWLLIGFCDISSNIDGSYNFTLNGRTVRGNGTNGGGCMNVIITKLQSDGFATIQLYQSLADTIKMNVYLQAIKLG